MSGLEATSEPSAPGSDGLVEGEGCGSTVKGAELAPRDPMEEEDRQKAIACSPTAMSGLQETGNTPAPNCGELARGKGCDPMVDSDEQKKVVVSSPTAVSGLETTREPSAPVSKEVRGEGVRDSMVEGGEPASGDLTVEAVQKEDTTSPFSEEVVVVGRPGCSPMGEGDGQEAVIPPPTAMSGLEVTGEPPVVNYDVVVVGGQVGCDAMVEEGEPAPRDPKVEEVQQRATILSTTAVPGLEATRELLAVGSGLTGEENFDPVVKGGDQKAVILCPAAISGLEATKKISQFGAEVVKEVSCDPVLKQNEPAPRDAMEKGNGIAPCDAKQAERDNARGEEKEAAGKAPPTDSSQARSTPTEVKQKWGPCLCDGKEHKTVVVERRAWPGINKPGGVGRIKKRLVEEEEVYGEKVMIAYFDVSYVLGGSEKRVKETFITCTQGEEEARESKPRDLFTVADAEPTRRSRPAKIVPLAQSPSKPFTAKKPSTSRKSPSSPLGIHEANGINVLSTNKEKPSKDSGLEKGKSKGHQKRPRAVSSSSSAVDGEDSNRARKMKKGDGKSTKENLEKQISKVLHANYMEREEEFRPQIKDLMAHVETKKANVPLSEGRMATFSAHLNTLFTRSQNPDMMPLSEVKAGIKTVVPQDSQAFTDGDIDAALKYLENENKVMLCDDDLHRV